MGPQREEEEDSVIVLVTGQANLYNFFFADLHVKPAFILTHKFFPVAITLSPQVPAFRSSLSQKGWMEGRSGSVIFLTLLRFSLFFKLYHQLNNF